MRVENAAKPWFWRLRGSKATYFSMVWRLRSRFLRFEAVKQRILRGFCSILCSKIALRRPPGGLRRGPGGPGGRQEAPNWRQSRFLSDFWCSFGPPNRSNLSWNLLQNGTPPWSDNFSHVEAGLGLDFGFFLGSILGSRAP